MIITEEVLYPPEMYVAIFNYCNHDLVAWSLVSHQLNDIAQDFAIRNMKDGFCGKAEWLKLGGDPGELPRISLKMYKEFDPKKELFTLIPETVNGVALTLSFMKTFSKNRLIFFDEDIKDDAVSPFKSHYVILSKDIVLRSRNKAYATQERLVQMKGGEIPDLIDTVVSLLMRNMLTGEFFYRGSSQTERWTYTRVKEKNKYGAGIVVGGFSDIGLYMDSHEFSFDTIGAGYSKSMGK